MAKERGGMIAGHGGSDSGGGGGWKHTCPHCGRNFLDNYHLKRHVKAIHEGPRPYKCDHPVDVGVGSGRQEPVAAGTDHHRAVETEEDGTRQQAGDRKEDGGGGGERSEGRGVEERVHGMCGAAFAKKWQLREHLYAEHRQTK